MKKLLATAVACAVLLSSCAPSKPALARRCERSTVKIGVITMYKKHKVEISGSGVAIGPHEVLTARHLFSMGHDKIYVLTSDGQTHMAFIADISAKYDLALITVPNATLHYASIAWNSPQVGENVYAVGWPLGIILNFTEGMVTSRADGMIIHQCPTLFGNSGGPLFDAYGRVVGINVAMITLVNSWAGISVSESAEHIWDFLGR